MNEEWNKLYGQMIQEMEDFNLLHPDTITGIEYCFNLGQKYWVQIEQEMHAHSFLSKNEEVMFYKEVKPLFKSQIEFYNLLYQAEIYKPAEEPGAMKEFWIREQHKLEKFIQNNEVFYAYCKNGQTNLDEEYFLSGSGDNLNGKAVYADDLLATLIALERYVQYVKAKLSQW